MKDYLKLSILIHLKDLIEKVEYFTFDPIFYNPICIENNIERIKKYIIGLNYNDILKILIRIRKIIKEEYNLISNEKPKFILVFITKLNINNINLPIIIINKKNNLKDLVIRKKIEKYTIIIYFKKKYKSLSLEPLIFNNKIYINLYQKNFKKVNNLIKNIEYYKKLKERIIIPIICFINNKEDFKKIFNYIKKNLIDNLYDFKEIDYLEKFASITSKTILLLNQLPRSNIPSRYEKLSYALNKYYNISISKFSFSLTNYSKRPFISLIIGKYDAIISGDVLNFVIGYFLSKIKKVPNFNDVRDPYLDFFTRNKLINRLLLFAFINKAKKVFYSVKYLVTEYKINKSKSVYLPNSAFLEWVNSLYNELNEKIYDLCYIGDYNENFKILFDSILLLENKYNYKTSLLIIGIKDQHKNIINENLKKYKITSLIKIIKPIPHNDLRYYITKCKIGLNMKEIGGGGKEFDYAAAGLPCIRLIKKGKEGDSLPWVIKIEKDPEKIAEIIFYLLKNKELYQKLSKKAIQSIKKKYNLYQISKKLLETIFGYR